jgi:hypothetical protein
MYIAHSYVSGTYNVHCNLGPSFYIFFKKFFWTQGRKENHRLDPMDLKFYTLAKNPQL